MADGVTLVTDWSTYGGHEMELTEVRAMLKSTPKMWGWANGMFIAGNDDFIAMRFLHGHTYEPVTRALWMKLCKDAELVIDVGAHSGTFTLDAVRSGAKNVLCVEPHPINYARLVINLRYNGFVAANAYYGALGATNGVDMLLVKNGLVNCHAAGRMGLHNPNGIEIPVRTMRMDSLVKKEAWDKIKAIKIDAENWTPQVLLGMGEILQCRPDLILECTVPGMSAILEPYGYRYWSIWESGKIEQCDDLMPYNPGNNYNGTDENCRNRFASVTGLP